MPKTPSHKLFQLIKSLTGSEKRYFKIFVNPTKDKHNKYIQLFDLIDNQSIFEEEKLIKKIYGKEKIESRKYSELKAYLYDLILKSLQGFDEKTSIDYRLKGMLLSVRALFKRSHYNDCIELLHKAKKLAIKHEQHAIILEILSWEKKIGYARSDMEFIGKNLSRIMEEEERYQEKLNNLNSYRNIFLKLLVALRKDVIRRGKIKEKVNELMDDPILLNEDQARSNLAKVLFHRIYAFYHYANSDIQKYYSTNKYLLELMESIPHYLKEDLSEYISVIGNYSVSCANLGKFDEVEQVLNKLDSLRPITRDNQLHIHRLFYTYSLKLCLTKGDFEKGVTAIESIPKKVLLEDRFVFENASFYFNCFCLYFGRENYSESLTYLNKWLGIPRKGERKDLQSLAKVLNLIIHYEMNNQMLIDSIIRSNTRYLSKQEGTFQFERILIAFFSKVNKMPPSNTVLIEAFKQLKEELLKDLKAVEEKRLLGVFDIISWIDSKVTQQPFAKIVKEKFDKMTFTSIS